MQSQNEKKIDKYVFLTTDLIGQGAFGKVYKGFDTQAKTVVAIKMVPKPLIQRDKYLMEGLKREISIMQKLRGKNVVRLLDMLESSNNYYIIQEFCQDGDLENFLRRQQYLTEVGALRVLTDVLTGFIELLQLGIIHRDLKPQNILVHQKTFKLCDFGFAKCISNYQMEVMQSQVGTPLYMAPQILLSQHYTSKSDIWSIGCIFYQCLFRRTPWVANSIPELINNIHKYPLEFPSHISLNARDFLSKCLQVKEEDRIDWNSLYRHPLVFHHFKEYLESVINMEDKAKFILSDLRQHIQRNKIDLLQTFKQLDLLNKQFITLKELQQLLNKIHPILSKQEIEFVFNLIDVDKANRIDFLEFQKCLQQHKVRMSMDFDNLDDVIVPYQDSPLEVKPSKTKTIIQDLKSQIESKQLGLVKLFKQYDMDNNTILDVVEFAQLLRSFNKNLSNEEISMVYAYFDKNSNGAVDYREFRDTLEEF